MSYRYVIGVDPGCNSGVAIRDTETDDIIFLRSMKIHEAIGYIQFQKELHDNIFVFVEDARLTPSNKYFANKENRKGLGSIMRDCQIWEDFLVARKIDHKMIKPDKKITKLTAKQFKQISGYEGKTNEHTRDAGMLSMLNPG